MTQVIFKNKGYDEGTINLNIREKIELHMTIKVTIIYVLWVARIHQFSFKSVLKLFGPKGDNYETK